jgi:class 3 adenylate cyclase
MSCRLNSFVKITEGLEEQTNTFLNQIVNIIHKCAVRWHGSANKTDGDTFLITWLFPNTDQVNNNESEAEMLECKTDFADKSLIAAVKIVSEMRRATYLKDYFRKKKMLTAFGEDSNSQPYITIGIH